MYAFDPAARGNVPVELMKDAAERYGYIVAGSNNSRNGSWKTSTEAARAMVQDTQQRFGIDINRFYYAGFSGGARLAASLAQACKCAAGVLLNGAGFAPSWPPAREATFAVFAAAGTLDFNYGEVVELQAKLGALHTAHALRVFDGTHEWVPRSVMDEAFAWFHLIAMKDGREEHDSAFVRDQAAEAEKRAKTLELAGDLYSSWREYRQAADTFAGLGEATAFRERADALEKEKEVREGAKREQQELAEQSRLSAEISSGMAALREDSSDSLGARSEVEQRIAVLRSRAEHEKNPQELRAVRRALAGIFVDAMESGRERSEVNDISRART